MNVGVISVDSDIGRELARIHTERGDQVWSTSRATTPKNGVDLELTDRQSWWPPTRNLDRVYFLLAVPDNLYPAKEVMNVNAVLAYDYLRYLAAAMNPGCKVVVFSSQFGSIAKANSGRAAAYRMSKAALNMGVRCLSFDFPDKSWCAYHPGVVKTKMIAGKEHTYNSEVLEIQDAAERCITFVNGWDGTFQFLSYTGDKLPW